MPRRRRVRSVRRRRPVQPTCRSRTRWRHRVRSRSLALVFRTIHPRRIRRRPIRSIQSLRPLRVRCHPGRVPFRPDGQLRIGRRSNRCRPTTADRWSAIRITGVTTAGITAASGIRRRFTGAVDSGVHSRSAPCPVRSSTDRSSTIKINRSIRRTKPSRLHLARNYCRTTTSRRRRAVRRILSSFGVQATASSVRFRTISFPPGTTNLIRRP